MKNREGFFKTIASDLRRGVMRPVYSSEDLTVLSVADSFYIASDYTVSEDGYIAFLVNSKMVRAMLVDPEFLQNLLTSGDQASLSKMLFRLKSDTFHSFKRTGKHRVFDALTHKFVDKELEQWIVETFGQPQIPVGVKADKSGLFSGITGLFSK